MHCQKAQISSTGVTLANSNIIFIAIVDNRYHEPKPLNKLPQETAPYTATYKETM